ncbi:MAG: CbiX/SirB N-terminal domain-containing protein [Candidatus Thiodiazotropha sp.]|jgi:hypothetical protein
MTVPTILLADNGSTRTEAVLNLRKLAQQLSKLCQHRVFPVPLQHANKISKQQLNGEPIDTLEPFLRKKLSEGERQFLLIPLFFGNSRALTSFIPKQVDSLQTRFGPFTLKQSEVLYPLPQGEPRLAAIVYEQLKSNLDNKKPPHIILVDHGSPIPEVTEVRKRVAKDLRDLLVSNAIVNEAVMERREGQAYDFNGDLLEKLLITIAKTTPNQHINLAPLFLSPGRHAGPGGDIEIICDQVRQRYPMLSIHIAPLVGQHPSLLDILLERLNSGLAEFRFFDK